MYKIKNLKYSMYTVQYYRYTIHLVLYSAYEKPVIFKEDITVSNSNF